MIKFLTILLTSLIIFACLEEPTAREKKIQKAEETVDWVMIEKSVKDLIEIGLIKKINAESKEAWVDHYQWTIINVEMKETFTKTLAFYCGRKKGDSLYYVDILDWSSGKKLAHYGSLGFKVF